MAKRYLEDIEENERLNCRPVQMTREEIIRFATEYDPQPFHIDDELASRSIFGTLIASSLHTLSACTKVVVEAQGDMAILSGVAVKEAKLYNPVFPGDTLTVDARWGEIRRSASKPDRGFASVLCLVTNQRRERVMEYGYRYLVACRDSR